MDARFQLEGAVQRGNWDESVDPSEAFNEMIAQGYDPDDEYCVGGSSDGLISVVHYGNLMECLTEAANRSNDGYFIVFRASDLSKFKQVELH